MRLEDRPHHVQFEGDLDFRTARGRYTGTLFFTADNQLRIIGVVEEDGPRSQCDDDHRGLQATLHGGTRMEVHPLRLRGATHSPLSRLEMTATRAKFSGPTFEDGSFEGIARLRLALSPSAVVDHFSKREMNLEFETLSALNLGLNEVSTAWSEAPDPMSWTFDDGVEVYIHQSVQAAEGTDDLGFPTRTLHRRPVVYATMGPKVWSPAEFRSFLTESTKRVMAILNTLSLAEGHRLQILHRSETLEAPETQQWNVQHKIEWCNFETIRPTRSLGRHLLGEQLHTAIPSAIAAFQEDGDQLYAAVSSYVAAVDSEHTPSQMLLLTTALESFKTLFLAANGREWLVEEAAFKKLRSKLEKHLKNELWDEELHGPASVRGNMKAKMGELNRPSYKATLLRMSDAWGLLHEEFTARDNPFEFVDFRDHLVHTGRIKGDDQLGFHTAMFRLQAFVERCICHKLGFTPSRSFPSFGFPPSHMMPEPEGEE